MFNVICTEWEKGFSSGLLATLCGFLLTICWDIYKNYRDKTEKDKITRRLIYDTLNENLNYASKIETAMVDELDGINRRHNLVENITNLKNDFWDLVKINIPKDLLKKEQGLKELQDIVTLIKNINEKISSRELYRIIGEGRSNYGDRLYHYDKLILSEIVKLKEKIITFQEHYNN